MSKVNGDAWKNTDAYTLARKLDLKDGDDGISKSVWEQFINTLDPKAKANTVKESLTLKEATASITKYFARILGTDFGNREKEKELTKIMSENIKKIEQHQAPEVAPAPEAEEPAPAEKPAPAKKTPEKAEPKYTTDDIKVKVPRHGVNAKKPTNKADVDFIIENRKDGKFVADGLKKAIDGIKTFDLSTVGNVKVWLKKVDKNNVAYVVANFPTIAESLDSVNALGQGLDKKDVYEKVLKPLQERAKELNLNNKQVAGLDMGVSDIKTMSPVIVKIAKAIREAEQKIVGDYNTKMRNYNDDVKAVNKYNRETLPKSQEAFDKANALLVEAANMTPEDKKGKIDKDDKTPPQWMRADIGDKWVKILLNENGEIEQIVISYDPTEENIDGETGDYDEVKYSADKAFSDFDNSNNEHEDVITSGYDFEKLKELAKKIFDLK